MWFGVARRGEAGLGKVPSLFGNGQRRIKRGPAWYGAVVYGGAWQGKDLFMLPQSVIEALADYGVARDEYNAAFGRPLDEIGALGIETLIHFAAVDGAMWLRQLAQQERERRE